MIGFIITCMKEIREDLELRHHMKLEMRHSLQTPNQYLVPENKRIIKYKIEHYTSSTILAA